MHSNRFVAFALTAMFLLVACGGGGGKNATSSSSTSSSSTSSSSSQSAQAKKAAEDLQKARDVANKAADPIFQDENADYVAGLLDGLKADMRKLRDVDFNLDKAVRAIDFPRDVTTELNNYLQKNGENIAAEDAAQNATTVLEFHHLERASIRIGAEIVEARMALQRKLGSPDPADPGDPKSAPQPRGTVVLHDDFSDSGSGWAEGSNQHGRFGYEQGKYGLVLNDPPQGSVVSDTLFDGARRDPKLEALANVSVSASVTKIQDVGGNVGLVCHEKASPFSGYIAAIDTTGDWVIGRSDGSNFKELTDSNGQSTRGVSTIIKDKGTNLLRMDCVTKGTSVTVTLYVNGKQVGEGTDTSSPLPAGAVAFTVDANVPVCCDEATFDDVEIRDLG